MELYDFSGQHISIGKYKIQLENLEKRIWRLEISEGCVLTSSFLIRYNFPEPHSFVRAHK